ncbi:MAG: M67 family metallopeptidase [Anaerolineales bacterium]
MSINIPEEILDQIHLHGEKAYPEEGAGLMLGTEKNGKRVVSNLLFLTNSREDTARHNRYLITAEDMLRGEGEAERLSISIIGIFHSHPDHPNQPSEFDREYAIPWYSYLITSIKSGKSSGSRCWRLEDDRERFLEENINILSK